MKKANIFSIYLSLSAFVLLSLSGLYKAPAQETDHQGTTQSQHNPGSLFNLNTLLSLSITQQTPGTPTPFIDLQYSYDGVGNITSIQDLIDSNNDISMQYDNLDRLTTANGPWQNGSFSYDALGNRTSSTIGTNTANFDYDPVTNRLQNLTYDNNGNVTNDGYFDYTYDSENRITQITNGTDVITYKYDGDGRRISQTVNGVKTVYAYGTGLNVLTEFNESGIPKVDYIYAGTTHIAREEFDEAGNPVKKTFYHTDQLGSTKTITNIESTEIWKQGYLPYGGTYSNEVNPYDPTSTTHQYTGKEIEQSVGSSGTYYYGARYYRPDLGRFMSTDPGPMDITNPQSFNRYAYVLNNPYRYTDPDGRVIETAWDILNVSLGVYSLKQDLTNGNYIDALIDVGEYL